jgi:hypothetical protein
MGTEGARAPHARAPSLKDAKVVADVEAGLGEEPRVAFAEDDRIVCDDYTHGISSHTAVPT